MSPVDEHPSRPAGVSRSLLSRSSWFATRTSAHRAILLSVVAGLATAAFVLQVGYDPPDTDVKYDWLVSREALRSGGDAYRGILTLGSSEGVWVRVNYPGSSAQIDVPHPRTPGALFLQLPIVGLPYHTLFALTVGINVALLGGLLAMSWQYLDRTLEVTISAVLVASVPVFLTVRYSSQSAFVGVVLLLGWLAVRRDREIVGGVLIGIGAVLKIFPLMLLIPLMLQRRLKASISILTTVAILNVAGLMLPGVGLDAAIDAMNVARATWYDLFTNASLSTLYPASVPPGVAQSVTLGITLAVGVWMAVREPRDLVLPFSWLILGLLVMPISWGSYDLILLPPLFALVVSMHRPLKAVAVTVVALWIAPVLAQPFTFVPSGPFVLTSRVLILATLAIPVAWERLGYWQLSLPGGKPGRQQLP